MTTMIYTIDGEQLTRAQIVERLADDLRRKRFAMSTLEARLANGARTWERLRRSAAEGRAISKSSIKGLAIRGGSNGKAW